MVFFSKKYTTAVNIAAGALSIEQFVSEADQYANGPFDSISIINDDTQTLQINLDGNPDNCITVLPNSRESGLELNYRNFTITNKGGSAHTAGKVYILVENTRTPRKK